MTALYTKLVASSLQGLFDPQAGVSFVMQALGSKIDTMSDEALFRAHGALLSDRAALLQEIAGLEDGDHVASELQGLLAKYDRSISLLERKVHDQPFGVHVVERLRSLNDLRNTRWRISQECIKLDDRELKARRTQEIKNYDAYISALADALEGETIIEEELSFLLKRITAEGNSVRSVSLVQRRDEPGLVNRLVEALKHPCCKLMMLDLSYMKITDNDLKDLAAYLSSPASRLVGLRISTSGASQEGVRALALALENPHCRLWHFGLDLPSVGAAIDDLGRALVSSECTLRLFDLRTKSNGMDSIVISKALTEISCPVIKFAGLSLQDGTERIIAERYKSQEEKYNEEHGHGMFWQMLKHNTWILS